jgi:hypothetical protein
MSHAIREKRIPASALRFKLSEIELSDRVEGDKSAPIRLIARGGKPIDHPYFGQVVHDFASMEHKPKIPIDYCHESKEVIGFVNKFDTSSGDLVLGGTIVPFRSGDRAAEVMHKSKAGVPYEASIDFVAPMQMETLYEGQRRMVNGSMVEGPATIISDWTLRGVAVCPYGADSNTSSQFGPGDEVTVSVLEEEKKEMATEAKTETKTAEAPAIQQFTSADALKKFGTDGAIWHAEGKAEAEMQTLHAAKETDHFKRIDQAVAALSAKVDEKFTSLDQRFAALTAAGGAGEATPLKFGSDAEKKEKRPGKGIRFAAGV